MNKFLVISLLLLYSLTLKAGYTIVDSTATDALCSVNAGGGQCLGDGSFNIEVLFNGGSSTPADYILLGPTTTSLQDVNSTNITFNNLCPGSYTLIIQDQNNITQFPFITFTIEGSPAITLSGTPTNPTCSGDEDGQIDLTITGGTAPFDITWNTGDTTDPITGIGVGTYDVLIKDDVGCEAADTFNLSDGDTVVASFNSNVACQNQTITFTDASQSALPLTYSWDFIDGTPANANSQGPHDVIYTTPGIRNIELIVDNGSCDDTAIVAVNILAQPTTSITPDSTICNGDTIQLTATGGVSFAWDQIAFIDDTTLASPLISPANDTTYHVIVTNASGCSALDSVEITVSAAPTITITSDTSICLGDSVQLNATGGNQFTWTPNFRIDDPSISNPTVFPNIDTTYQVVVQNAATCIDSATVSVSIIPLPIVAITNDTSICVGDSIQLTASGGTSYIWTPGTNIDNIAIPNPIVFPPVLTTYFVDVTDANNCTSRDSVEITIDALPVIIISNDTSICLNDAAQLNASGGTGYTWTPSVTLNNSSIANPEATPLTTTTYEVVVTDANVCRDTADVTVTVTLPPTITTSGDQTICQLDTALIWAAGGVTYSWTPIANLFTPSNDSTNATPLATTTYAVRVTNAVGCFSDSSVTVNVNALPTVTTSNDTTICQGDTALLNASGALIYSWTPTSSLNNPGISNPEGTPNTSTIYQVIGEDVNTCRDTATVSVTVTLPPIVTTSGTQTICENDTAQIFANGGTTYSWSPLGDLFTPNNDTTLANPIVTTTYSVRVINGLGCFKDTSVAVNVNPIPTVNASNDTTICQDDFANLSATGAINYVWSPADSLSNPNSANPLANPQATTTYIVTGTDAIGCGDTSSVTVTVSLPPSITTSGDQTICSTDTVKVFASGGTGTVWAGASIISINGDTAFVNPSSTSVYTATVSTALGCTKDTTVTVNVNAPPTVTTSGTQTICENDTAQIFANGGTTYSWSPLGDLLTPNNDTTLAIPVATTTYSVRVIDGFGCIKDTSVTVTVNPIPSVDASNDTTICQDDFANLSATGALNYVWTPTSNLSDPNSASPTANPQNTTTYFVTGTDAIGCGDTSSVTVTVSLPPSITTSGDQTICNSDTVKIFASGGTGTVWAGASIISISGDTAFVNPSSTSVYTATVSTALGCTKDTTVTVYVNALPTITVSNDTTICFGDIANLSASGAVNYSWSPVDSLATPNSSSTSANPSSTTTYTVTGIDGNFCSSNEDVIVTVLPAITIMSSGDQTICENDTAKIWANGGNSTVWIGASIVSVDGDTAFVTPATSSSFTATVSNVIGCSQDTTVTVNVLPSPIITTNGTQTICENDSVELIAFGGVTYTWTGVNVSTPNNDSTFVSPTNSSTYVVTVNDGTCSDTSHLTVNVNPTPNAIVSVDQTICEGDTTTIVAAGGVAFDWLPVTDLSSPGLANSNAFPSVTTTYMASVRDANGCEDTASTTIFVNAVPIITTSADDSICIGETSSLSAFGGNTYTWSPGNTLDDSTLSNPVSTPTATTRYIVTGTSIEGCSDTNSVLVTVNPLPTITVTPDIIICDGDSTVLNASGAAIYSWAPALDILNENSASPTVFPNSDRRYSVTAIDTNGCTDTTSTLVSVVTNITVATIPSISDTLCFRDTLNIQATGAVDYIWTPSTSLSDPASNNTEAFPSTTTTYKIVGTTPAGCADSTTFTLVVRDPITLDISSTDTLLCSGDTTTLRASSGLTNYIWTPSIDMTAPNDSVTSVFPTITTDYEVQASASGGCPAFDTITVSVNQLPVVTVSPKEDTICRNETISLTVSSGTASGFSWSPDSTLSSNIGTSVIASPNVDHSYIVTGTDANGCVGSDTATILIEPVITIDLIPNDTLCAGDTVILTAAVVNGISYRWEPALSGNIAQPDSLTTTAIPVGTTTYTLTVTNIAGCTNSDSATVSVIPFPGTGITTSHDTICPGDTAQLIASGGTNYSWTPTTSMTSPSNDSTEVFPLINTTYVAAISTPNGCTTNDSISIIVDPIPVPSIIGTDTICGNDTIVLKASGGVTYSWIGNGLITAAEDSVVIAPTSTTTFYVEAANNIGCTAIDSFTVVVNALPTTSVSSNRTTICFGDTTQLIAAGGAQYVWSNADSLSDSTIANPIVNPSKTSTFFVSISGTNNCSVVDSITIAVDSLPVVVISSDQSLCEGDSVSLTASGGNQFSWSPLSSLTTPNNATTFASPTNTTEYKVVVTNGNNCTDSATTIVTVNNLPTGLFLADNDTICFGASTNVIAQLDSTFSLHPFGSFSFDGGKTFSGVNQITYDGLSSGDSTLFVTLRDQFSCSLSSPISEDIHTLEEITYNIDTVQFPECVGPPGEFNLLNLNGGMGPYQVIFEGDTSLMTTTDTTNYNSLLPGIYLLEINDAYECSSSQPLNFNSSITFDTAIVNPVCFSDNNGEINISNVKGGVAPYEFSLNDTLNYQLDSSFIALLAGNHTLFVKDDTGCVIPLTFNLVEPDLFEISNLSTTNIICPENENGQIFFEGTGGNTPYTFNLNSDLRLGTGQFNYANLAPMVDTISGVDNRGCLANLPFSIEDAASFGTFISEDKAPADCFANDGTAKIDSTTGGSGNFRYALDFVTFKDSLSFVTVDLIGLGLGQYTVITEDVVLGCVDTSTFSINIGLNIDTVDIISSPPSCLNNDGALTIINSLFIGAPTPYEYELRQGTSELILVPFQDDTTFSDLGPGVYNLIIRDDASCEYSFSGLVDDHTPISITDAIVTPESCKQTNGVIELVVVGGTGSTTYSLEGIDNPFSASGNSPIFTGLAPGTYRARAQEPVNPNCGFDRAIIIPTNSIDVQMNIDSVQCPDGKDGQLQIVTIDNSIPGFKYAFNINDSTSFSSDTSYSGFPAGQHTLFIQETNPFDSSTCIYIDDEKYFDVTIDGVFHDSITIPGFIVSQPDTLFALTASEKSGRSIDDGMAWLFSMSGGSPGYSLAIDEATNFTNLSNFDDPSRQFSGVGPGEHTIYLQDSHGCIREFKVEVGIKFFVPNIFTPNNDGSNDTFIIFSLEEGSELMVVDKWGTVVYESTNYQNDWDGGREPDGLYFYELKIPAVETSPGQVMKGWIQLIR